MWNQAARRRLLHLHPELPHVLVELVAQVLQLVGGDFVHFAQALDSLANSLGHGRDALGHQDEHLLVGEVAAGKFA